MRRSMIFLAMVFLIATGVRAAGPSPSGPGPACATLTPVPTSFPFSSGVEGMSVASVGDKIIAALGYDSGDTNLTRIYDIDG